MDKYYKLLKENLKNKISKDQNTYAEQEFLDIYYENSEKFDTIELWEYIREDIIEPITWKTRIIEDKKIVIYLPISCKSIDKLLNISINSSIELNEWILKNRLNFVNKNWVSNIYLDFYSKKSKEWKAFLDRNDSEVEREIQDWIKRIKSEINIYKDDIKKYNIELKYYIQELYKTKKS